MNLQADRSKPGLSSLGLLPPLFLVLAAGSLLGWSLQSPSALRADVASGLDADNDGLVDAQELVLGTSPSSVDTDQDGYSDLEELARKTSPLAPQMFPDEEDRTLGVGMSCYWANGKLHATIALYTPDQNLHDKTFRVGMLIGHRIHILSTETLLARCQVASYPAHDRRGMITVLDLPFSANIVHSHGSVTVFATAGDAATGTVAAADAAQLLDVGGVVVFCKVDHTTIASWTNTTNGHQHASTSGLIYVPLGDDDGPLNWTPGAICYQQTEVVGTSGALITEEVVSAECLDGWEGSCPSSCPDTVGTTTTTIDPVRLIGG
jgi:hypothetical protein